MTRDRRNKEPHLDRPQKWVVALAVGAAAIGNLVGCAAEADTAPEPASTSIGVTEAAPEPVEATHEPTEAAPEPVESAEVADDQYVDKLELTKEQFGQFTDAAKTTATARIDFVKARLAVTDPDNRNYSVDNYDDGSLVMASSVHTNVEHESYDLEMLDDTLLATPVQSANGLEIKFVLSHNESCYTVGQDSYDAELCKKGQKSSNSILTFVNPDSKVFSDFFLTEEDLGEYLASPDTTLIGASKSGKVIDSQGGVIDSQHVSVELDGATVLKQGTKGEILAALTIVTSN